MRRSSLQKLTPSLCQKQEPFWLKWPAVGAKAFHILSQNFWLHKEKPKIGLSPASQGPWANLRGRDYIQWRLRQMALANGRFLCARCPAQTRFNLNNKSLQVSPTRSAYNSPQSCCNLPLWDNVTAHPEHYSPTLVRRRIKCHFHSFPIWSKFLVDKMQMRAIIWQVIWWCRRYGGYA